MAVGGLRNRRGSLRICGSYACAVDYDLEGMNAFDLGFLVLGGLLFLIGLLKGLTRLFVGMTALVAAFVLAAGQHADAGAVLLARFPMSELLANVIGYVAVFRSA